MVQRITRFSIGQTAKVVGLLYGVLGVILLPFFLIVAALGPEESGFGVGFALALPVLYGAAGFIFTAIGCALYNWLAGMVGGVELELETSTHVR